MKVKSAKKIILRAIITIVFVSLAVVWTLVPYFNNGGRYEADFVKTKASIRVTKHYAGEIGGPGEPGYFFNYHSTFTYDANGTKYTDERSGQFPHEVTIYYDPKNPSRYVLSKTFSIKPIVIRGITSLTLGCVMFLLIAREIRRVEEEGRENKKKKKGSAKKGVSLK